MNNAQEPVLHHFSTVFHIQAFANLDRFCQQEIISDLATQIGTNPKTRNIGLKTMVSMITNFMILLPCPFTGPKMFWAGPIFLCQTKILFTYYGSQKHFVPDKKMICIQ